MGYVIYKFQNASGLHGDAPSIIVEETHPEWDKIMQNWRNGKNPTDSKLWKKGVIALTKKETQLGNA